MESGDEMSRHFIYPKLHLPEATLQSQLAKVIEEVDELTLEINNPKRDNARILEETEDCIETLLNLKEILAREGVDLVAGNLQHYSKLVKRGYHIDSLVGVEVK